MQNVALSWLVYRLTDSVFLLGLVGFTTQIPTFILSPFTGVYTDKHDKLRIMIGAQIMFMIQAVALAVLTLTEMAQVWHIVALSLLFGIISAFDAPARQSLVVDLIDEPDHLSNAIALNSAIFNAARLVGPAIAGVTIAAVGEGICFFLNAASFIAVIYALLQVKIEQKKRQSSDEPFLKSFMDGLKYTFANKVIRTLIILLAILSLAGFPFIVLLPAYAKEVLSGGAETLGYLMSSLGAGALVGALFMASRKPDTKFVRLIGINTIILGVFIVLASLSHSFYASTIVLFVAGVSMILALSSVNTLLQTSTNEQMRGRVMSFYAMALMGMLPIGNLIIGTMAEFTGISLSLTVGGAITLLSGIWFWSKKLN